LSDTETFGDYGSNHKALRRAIGREVVALGLAVCWRCGQRIEPAEPWDLGHVPGSRTLHAGPEHRACNRATAAKVQRRYSRRW